MRGKKRIRWSRYLSIFATLGIWLCLVGTFCFTLPQCLGWELFAVSQKDLEPVYPAGSLALVRPASLEQIHLGEYVAYRQEKETLMGQVVSIDREAGVFYTQENGGAKTASTASQLVGEMEEWTFPYLGYLVLWLKGGGIWIVPVLWVAVLMGCLFVSRKRTGRTVSRFRGWWRRRFRRFS